MKALFISCLLFAAPFCFAQTANPLEQVSVADCNGEFNGHQFSAHVSRVAGQEAFEVQPMGLKMAPGDSVDIGDSEPLGCNCYYFHGHLNGGGQHPSGYLIFDKKTLDLKATTNDGVLALASDILVQFKLTCRLSTGGN